MVVHLGLVYRHSPLPVFFRPRNICRRFFHSHLAGLPNTAHIQTTACLLPLGFAAVFADLQGELRRLQAWPPQGRIRLGGTARGLKRQTSDLGFEVELRRIAVRQKPTHIELFDLPLGLRHGQSCLPKLAQGQALDYARKHFQRKALQLQFAAIGHMLALVAPGHTTVAQIPFFAIFKAQGKVLAAQVLPQAL